MVSVLNRPTISSTIFNLFKLTASKRRIWLSKLWNSTPEGVRFKPWSTFSCFTYLSMSIESLFLWDEECFVDAAFIPFQQFPSVQRLSLLWNIFFSSRAEVLSLWSVNCGAKARLQFDTLLLSTVLVRKREEERERMKERGKERESEGES